MTVQEQYDEYRETGNGRIALMTEIKKIAVSDIRHWGIKRHCARFDADIVSDLADDVLIAVMPLIDKKIKDLRVRHEIFTKGRTIFRHFLIERQREERQTNELENIIDMRTWDSPVLRPQHYIEAGTLWTPKTMLTLKRAAKELGISVRHMYRLVAWDEIRWQWYGGRKVITVGALREFRERIMALRGKAEEAAIAED